MTLCQVAHAATLRAAYLAGGIRLRHRTTRQHVWPIISAGVAGGAPTVYLHGFGTSKDAMLLPMPLDDAGHVVFADGRRVVQPAIRRFLGQNRSITASAN